MISEPEAETAVRITSLSSRASKVEARLDWMQLLLLLARHWRGLAGAVTASTVVAIGISLLLPNVYTARTVILPPQQTQSLLPGMMGQLSSIAGLAGRDLGIKSPADLYAGILQSETIKTELVNHFGLMQVYESKRYVDARKKLAGRTDVAVRTKEGLIDVSVEDNDPQRAADLANAYVEGLFRLNEKLAITEASQRRLFFEQELRKTREALAHTEDAMKHTQESTGLLAVEAQAKGIIESISSLEAQIAGKEIQLRSLRTSATEKNPTVVLAEEELAGLKAELQKAKTRGGGSGDPMIGPARIPGTSLEYLRSLRDVKYQETLFELLVKQYEAARIDEAKSAPLIQVIDTAMAPEKRSGPPRTLIVLAAAFLSLVIATFFAISTEAYQRFVSDPEKLASLELARATWKARPASKS
jgi:tyrosine-protein kinase Etk/Wzc